jgi:hypothetical protein
MSFVMVALLLGGALTLLVGVVGAIIPATSTLRVDIVPMMR